MLHSSLIGGLRQRILLVPLQREKEGGGGRDCIRGDRLAAARGLTDTHISPGTTALSALVREKDAAAICAILSPRTILYHASPRRYLLQDVNLPSTLCSSGRLPTTKTRRGSAPLVPLPSCTSPRQGVRAPEYPRVSLLHRFLSDRSHAPAHAGLLTRL